MCSDVWVHAETHLELLQQLAVSLHLLECAVEPRTSSVQVPFSSPLALFLGRQLVGHLSEGGVLRGQLPLEMIDLLEQSRDLILQRLVGLGRGTPLALQVSELGPCLSDVVVLCVHCNSHCLQLFLQGLQQVYDPCRGRGQCRAKTERICTILP